MSAHRATTQDQDVLALELYLDGLTQVEVAAALGVSRKVIIRITKGHTRQRGPRGQSVLLRFKRRTETGPGCWAWSGYKDPNGYGRLAVKGPDGWSMQLAHRVSYGLFVDDLGELDVLHKCDNPECTNPDHLFLGTQADNMKDMAQKGRSCRGEAKPNAKLTWDGVDRIRAGYRCGGVTQSDLSEEYGVSQSIISKVLSGKSWRLQCP